MSGSPSRSSSSVYYLGRPFSLAASEGVTEVTHLVRFMLAWVFQHQACTSVSIRTGEVECSAFPPRVKRCHSHHPSSQRTPGLTGSFHPHSPLAVDSSDASNKITHDDPSPSSTLLKDHFVVTNDSSVWRFRFDTRHYLNDPS